MVKKTSAYNLVKFPQYKPTTIRPDTLNVLQLDSLPDVGDYLTLWRSDAFVTEFELVAGSQNTNGIFIRRNTGNSFDPLDVDFLRVAAGAWEPIILTVMQVSVKGKISRTSWSYRVKFTPRALADIVAKRGVLDKFKY